MRDVGIVMIKVIRAEGLMAADVTGTQAHSLTNAYENTRTYYTHAHTHTRTVAHRNGHANTPTHTHLHMHAHTHTHKLIY